jgi:hypothetical protein
MESNNEKPDGRDDEVRFVDILSVFIAKRRLWIAITLIGAALGLLVSLSGLLRTGTKGDGSSYSSTTRAYVPESRMGDSAAALATCGAAADLVTKDVGKDVRKDYVKIVSAAYDPKTHFLSVTVKAGTEEEAKALSTAAVRATTVLLDGQGQGSNRYIAETLDAQRRQLENEAATGRDMRSSDELHLASIARVARMEAEAYRDSMRLDPSDISYLALNSLVQNRVATENLAIEAYARKLGVGPTLGRDARAALSREVAALLVERIALYKTLASADSQPLFVVDSTTKAVEAAGFSFPAKKFILIVFASLFIGILVAFCANAWDRIRNDPESMDKLRAAWGKEKKE